MHGTNPHRSEVCFGNKVHVPQPYNVECLYSTVHLGGGVLHGFWANRSCSIISICCFVPLSLLHQTKRSENIPSSYSEYAKTTSSAKNTFVIILSRKTHGKPADQRKGSKQALRSKIPLLTTFPLGRRDSAVLLTFTRELLSAALRGAWRLLRLCTLDH
jgi:hypothetical protein